MTKFFLIIDELILIIFFFLFCSAMFEIAVISFVVFALFYWCRQRFRQLPLPYYEGRHVIITGCDTGFGNMLAKELDNRGFSVFAGCFTSNGEEELKKSCSHKLQCFPLDVSKTESIQRALLFIKSKLPRDTGKYYLGVSNILNTNI